MGISPSIQLLRREFEILFEGSPRPPGVSPIFKLFRPLFDRLSTCPPPEVSPIFKFLLEVPDDRAKPIIDDDRARPLGNQLDFAPLPTSPRL
jgi:hypothetical protein